MTMINVEIMKIKVVVRIFSGPGCRMAAHPASRVSGRRPPRRASSRQCLAARLATLPSHIARAISLDVAGRGSAYFNEEACCSCMLASACQRPASR